jgi:hypothetical protein
MQTILGQRNNWWRAQRTTEQLYPKIKFRTKSNTSGWLTFKADLLDVETVIKALKNTQIAYLTVDFRMILKYGLETG